MRTRKPKTVPIAPGLAMHFDGHDCFLIANGKKIAKRGRPGTPQAKSWIALDPTYEVFNYGQFEFGFRRKNEEEGKS